MKLFATYNKINLLTTILIFLIASAAYYFLLNYVFMEQVDDDLRIEEKEIETYVKEYNRPPESISVKDQLINYTPSSSLPVARQFTTIVLKEPGEAKGEDFRRLVFGISAGGKLYTAAVSKSLEDIDNIIHSILLITLSTILLILAASFIINRYFLKRLWRPFYLTLATVKDFKISRQQELQFSQTGIEEFRFMNETLGKLTAQAHHDYLSLKTFSENASHEMQTPLAVIRSKLDLLIQDEGLTEQQSKTLQSAYTAIEKLARLNGSLLLLARIENNQYAEQTPLHLKHKIAEKEMDFGELWATQHLKVSIAAEDVIIQVNNELADILLNNLLSNATRHNFAGGTIHISLTRERLMVSNSSHQPALDPSRLFCRFYKSAESGNSNGLGLSIIKEICDASGFSIRYDYKPHLHSFTIGWA